MEAEIEALKKFGVNIQPGHADGYRKQASGEFDLSTQVRPWEVAMPKQIGWHFDHGAWNDSWETWNNPLFLTEVRRGIAYLTFNEPDNNNSFSPGVSNGLTDSCFLLRNDPNIRMAVLTGAGRMWSAGGDPRGFQQSQRVAGVIGAEDPKPAQLERNYDQSKSRPPDAGRAERRDEGDEARGSTTEAELEESYSEFGKAGGEHELYGGPPGYAIVQNEHHASGLQKNIKDAVMGAGMFYAWATIPQFSMACMNGSAMGGALGLLAGSDYVVAVKSAFAVLSEVRLGVIPAVVSPHVIRAVGTSNAKRIFATAENLSTAKALDIGLIQRIVTKKDEFPAVVAEIAEKIQAVAPGAVAAAKAAIFSTLNQPMSEKLMHFVTEEYVRTRRLPECEEGMRALSENRAMPWQEKKIEVKEGSL